MSVSDSLKSANKQAKQAIDAINKTPMQSKKFIATMSFNCMWFILLILAIKTSQSNDLLLRFMHLQLMSKHAQSL